VALVNVVPTAKLLKLIVLVHVGADVGLAVGLADGLEVGFSLGVAVVGK
jgi:hypothetical protein